MVLRFECTSKIPIKPVGAQGLTLSRAAVGCWLLSHCSGQKPDRNTEGRKVCLPSWLQEDHPAPSASHARHHCGREKAVRGDRVSILEVGKGREGRIWRGRGRKRKGGKRRRKEWEEKEEERRRSRK